MEFSSFFFHLLFFGLIFQLSNTIVSSAKVKISAQNAPINKLDSLTEQMDADIGKRLVQQRIKRDTDDDMDDNMGIDINHEPIPEDVVYIDYRESGCIDEPRSCGQDGCRASYAFATISFYEWFHCQKTGRYQAFSEQFIIDCSFSHGNSGCNGGNPAKAMMFVNQRGLILREFYPYTGIQGDCPFDDPFSYENMISFRINEPNVNYISLGQLVEHLEYGPIIVIIEISENFLLYRGGVDDNVGHSPELLHTMLLIGHGREKGKEYWLFRNSHFADYINDGHYKLNKDVDCFKGEFGIGVRRSTLE